MCRVYVPKGVVYVSHHELFVDADWIADVADSVDFADAIVQSSVHLDTTIGYRVQRPVSYLGDNRMRPHCLLQL